MYDELDELYEDIGNSYVRGWADAESKFLPLLTGEMKENISLRNQNESLTKSERESRVAYAEKVDAEIAEKKAEYEQRVESMNEKEKKDKVFIEGVRKQLASIKAPEKARGNVVYVVSAGFSSDAPMVFSSERKANLYAKTKSRNFPSKVFKIAIL